MWPWLCLKLYTQQGLWRDMNVLFIKFPPPGSEKPWYRLYRHAAIIRGETIKPWLITMLMRENWWLTEVRETRWIKTKLSLKGNLIPIVPTQGKSTVWQCKNKHNLSFCSIRMLHQTKWLSVLKIASGATWHLSPLIMIDGLAAICLSEQYRWMCVRVKNTGGKKCGFWSKPRCTWILASIQATTAYFPLLAEVLQSWWPHVVPKVLLVPI